MEELEIKAKIGECQLELEQLEARAKQIIGIKTQMIQQLIQMSNEPKPVKKAVEPKSKK